MARNLPKPLTPKKVRLSLRVVNKFGDIQWIMAIVHRAVAESVLPSSMQLDTLTPLPDSWKVTRTGRLVVFKLRDVCLNTSEGITKPHGQGIKFVKKRIVWSQDHIDYEEGGGLVGEGPPED